MKYVNFKSVSIKNFLSVGETPVVIEFNRGLNIITGCNKDKTDRRNGVGKSTVADSIYFAIFGEPLRSIKRDHIINSTTQRGCEVELLFTINSNGRIDEYKITRKLSPSKCYLYKNGEDITRDTIQNTTQYVQDLINTTSDIFQNCVIMTINNATPFMAKKKLDKRKFIEGIFNLQVFSDMLSQARAEYNKVSKDLDIECARYEEISNTLDNQQLQKQNAAKDRERMISKLKARQDQQQVEIKSTTTKIAAYEQIDTAGIEQKIEAVNNVIPTAESKIHKLVTRITELSVQKSMLQQKHDKINSEHSTCPVCLHKLNDTHKNYIQKEKNKMLEDIKQTNIDVNELKTKLEQAKELKKVLENKRDIQKNKLQKAQIQKSNLRTLKEQLRQSETTLKDIEDDIRSTNVDKSNFDELIAETTTRLEQSQSAIDKIKQEMSMLDIIKFVVSEEGVKSYIVKKMLQLFNSKLAYYLKKMDSNCICVFNEYFEEEIVNEKGNLCSYFNFSGAERKNIDLACLFAFMDIRRLQGEVAFNFSMYDELFDSSLDERGVELVIEILKERIENHNECAIVISHRKESTKLATGEVIFLEKQNGVTTRVETPENELK